MGWCDLPKGTLECGLLAALKLSLMDWLPVHMAGVFMNLAI